MKSSWTSKFALLAIAIAGSACASRAKQTEDWFARAHDEIPSVVTVPHVPFIAQTAGTCGPATLAMAMKWAGHDVTLEGLTPEVYTPASGGSLQGDLISAGRRHGLMTIPISGLPSLIAEVRAGHPVIVFENLSVSWLPRWHYALVYGYDLPRREVIMHSGPEEAKRWSMDTFERSWELADHWGLVVLPPGELSASAGEIEHLQAASALEKIGHRAAAETAYFRILDRWPRSLGALIGLGNVAASRGDKITAEKYLSLAVDLYPDSAAARHNLAIVQRR